MHDSSPPAALAGFPVVVSWPVQWGDQDAFGHVNNTIYFRWFESGRIAYLKRLGLDNAMFRHRTWPDPRRDQLQLSPATQDGKGIGVSRVPSC